MPLPTPRCKSASYSALRSFDRDVLSIDTIVAETGFADRERMRRAFLRAFGQPPQVIRRNARVD